MAGRRSVAGHVAAACIFTAAGWGVATSEAADARFRRGDVDASGGIKITDPIVLLGHLFQGGATPGCLDAADADDNGRVQITGAIYLLGYLFTGGPAPRRGRLSGGPRSLAAAPREQERRR